MRRWAWWGSSGGPGWRGGGGVLVRGECNSHTTSQEQRPDAHRPAACWTALACGPQLPLVGIHQRPARPAFLPAPQRLGIIGPLRSLHAAPEQQPPKCAMGCSRGCGPAAAWQGGERAGTSCWQPAAAAPAAPAHLAGGSTLQEDLAAVLERKEPEGRGRRHEAPEQAQTVHQTARCPCCGRCRAATATAAAAAAAAAAASGPHCPSGPRCPSVTIHHQRPTCKSPAR